MWGKFETHIQVRKKNIITAMTCDKIIKRCIISFLWCLSQGLFCLVARPEINKQASRSKRNDTGLLHRQYIRCALFEGPLSNSLKSPGQRIHSQKEVSKFDKKKIVRKILLLQERLYLLVVDRCRKVFLLNFVKNLVET